MKFKYWLETILVESKQGIIGLRYPEIIAKLLYEEFGQHAPLIAKWYREYRFSGEIPDNWWLQVTADYRRNPSLYDLTTLYAATNDIEEYTKILDKLELSLSSRFLRTSPDETYLQNQKNILKPIIKATFFNDAFFTYPIIKDIKDNNLTNVAPYKQLKFWEAQHKYDAKNIFQDKTPLKTYKNGFKWIDVGRKCDLVGSLMKNCGSAGLMSMDGDATMFVLFGPDNVGHVVATYSPKEKIISGDEGVASTEVKSKYHTYVLDLVKTLGATFAGHKSRSGLLKVKYLLQNKATGLRQIKGNGVFDNFFMFNIQGKPYYSNEYVMVSKDDIEKVQKAIKQGELTLRINTRSIARNIFNHMNQPILNQFGVKYIPLNQLI